MFIASCPKDRRDIMAADEQSDYIPRKQLAEQLGKRLRGRPYAEITLRVWERDGKGPVPIRVGRDVVYPVRSVEKWLRDQEESAAKNSANADAA
jgi:hypothetical protein